MHDIDLSPTFQQRFLEWSIGTEKEAVRLISSLREFGLKDLILLPDLPWQLQVWTGEGLGDVRWVIFNLDVEDERVEVLAVMQMDGPTTLY
jgi:hypothetical protein